MSPIQKNTALQNVLLLDAATCVAAGALMALAPSFVADLTAIPAPLLFWAGLILFAGIMYAVKQRLWAKIEH